MEQAVWYKVVYSFCGVRLLIPFVKEEPKLSTLLSPHRNMSMHACSTIGLPYKITSAVKNTQVYIIVDMSTKHKEQTC